MDHCLSRLIAKTGRDLSNVLQGWPHPHQYRKGPPSVFKSSSRGGYIKNSNEDSTFVYYFLYSAVLALTPICETCKGCLFIERLRTQGKTIMKRTFLTWKQRGESEIAILIAIASLVAWCTHIYVCFNGNRWGFLIAGALFFPIAIIHGIGIWFGFWH